LASRPIRRCGCSGSGSPGSPPSGRCGTWKPRRSAGPGEPLLTPIDSDLAGLSHDRRLPTAEEDDLIAVSEPVTLADIHEGYIQASHILDTAYRFGLRGVITSSDLGLRSVILAVPATSRE